VSKSKSAAVKIIGIDIDITDILGSEISVNIDIGKGDIDPTLISCAVSGDLVVHQLPDSFRKPL